MAELRRLFIDPARIKALNDLERPLSLTKDESHYLMRVLRLRKGDTFAIVDGIGHLWEVEFNGDNSVEFCSSINSPNQDQPCSFPLIGLAFVVPRRGSDVMLRMCCEIGVDIVQPLRSNRRIPQAEDKNSRWEKILREAVEQSERLWKPKLLDTLDFKDWLANLPSKSAFAFATTRQENLDDLQVWIDGLANDIGHVWVAIGPEGGWTENEILSAQKADFVPIKLGELILTTSTAAVVATQTIVSWRRKN